MKLQNISEDYNKWSGGYDSYVNSTVAIDDIYFPPYYSKLQNKNILEIGCGTGRHTTRLLEQGNHVTALDNSAGMLQQLKEKTTDSKLTLIKADFLIHDFHHIQFDAIIMSLVLEHIKELNVFFKKAHSLMSENAEFYFSELHPLRSAKGTGANFVTESRQQINLTSYPHSAAEISEAITSSGLKVLQCDSILGDKNFAKQHQGWDKYIDRPMIQIWQLLK